MLTRKLFTQLMGIFVCSLLSGQVASKVEYEVFDGHDENSVYEISYQDLDDLLRLTVLDVGRSSRKKAPHTRAKLGTRLKSKRSISTALEGNRFNYDSFKDDSNKAVVREIRRSLEKVPDEIALNKFKNNEQLAYWLNLYNLALMEQLIYQYPKTNIEDLLYDDDGLLNKKILKVSGVSLSLNDIQHKIVNEKFGYTPLVMYGFSQGVIGGPNLRRSAYKGKTILKQLERNAEEFINSNRGTYEGGKNELRVSQYYEINKRLFPNFEQDLKSHLAYYIDSEYSNAVENAESFDTNISDMNISDLMGGYRDFGSSSNTNTAALLDSVSGDSPLDKDPKTTGIAGVGANNIGDISEMYQDHSAPYGRFPPDVIKMLMLMKEQQETQSGQVTIKKTEDNGAENN